MSFFIAELIISLKREIVRIVQLKWLCVGKTVARFMVLDAFLGIFKGRYWDI